MKNYRDKETTCKQNQYCKKRPNEYNNRHIGEFKYKEETLFLICFFHSQESSYCFSTDEISFYLLIKSSLTWKQLK